jgi:hypothetical protein
VVDAIGFQLADSLETSSSVDPDLVSGVHHHFVDLGIAQEHVEFAEAAYARDRLCRQMLLPICGVQRSKPANLVVDDVGDVSAKVGDASADLGDDLAVRSI